MKFLSFIFPETTKKQIDSMPAEMRLKFYEAVTDYGMYGTEPSGLTDIENVIWIPMKDLIDSCAERRGAPSGNSNATRKNNSGNSETNENKKNNSGNSETNEIIESSLSNGNGNGNDNDNLKELGVSDETQGFSDENPASPQEGREDLPEKTPRFAKPTLDEIAAYCAERKNGIEARSFFDFYESKGWLIGKAKMKDWRACVRTWEQRKRNEDSGGRGRAGAMWGRESEVPGEYLEMI